MILTQSLVRQMASLQGVTVICPVQALPTWTCQHEMNPKLSCVQARNPREAHHCQTQKEQKFKSQPRAKKKKKVRIWTSGYCRRLRQGRVANSIIVSIRLQRPWIFMTDRSLVCIKFSNVNGSGEEHEVWTQSGSELPIEEMDSRSGNRTWYTAKLSDLIPAALNCSTPLKGTLL